MWQSVDPTEWVAGEGQRFGRVAVPPPLQRLRSQVALWLIAACLALSGCEREARRFRDKPPPPDSRTVSLSELHPGTIAPKTEQGPYDDEAWSIAEGQRYFIWFNCNGCHANGGGGMGPALMDEKWIYGHEPANIFASIVEGRPNGMPSFRGRIPDQQVWQLVGYVRSLSGQLRKDVEPGRSDSINARPAPLATPPERPVNSK